MKTTTARRPDAPDALAHVPQAKAGWPKGNVIPSGPATRFSLVAMGSSASSGANRLRFDST
jgi:hypothetical protein